MSLLFFFFMLCSFIFFKFFSKKLVPLLCLEAVMIFFICFFFCFKGESEFFSLSFYSLCFLVMMVLDSVLGICLLVLSSRSSCSFSLVLC